MGGPLAAAFCGVLSRRFVRPCAALFDGVGSGRWDNSTATKRREWVKWGMRGASGGSRDQQAPRPVARVGKAEGRSVRRARWSTASISEAASSAAGCAASQPR